MISFVSGCVPLDSLARGNLVLTIGFSLLIMVALLANKRTI